jgi:hypothetical protein
MDKRRNEEKISLRRRKRALSLHDIHKGGRVRRGSDRPMQHTIHQSIIFIKINSSVSQAVNQSINQSVSQYFRINNHELDNNDYLHFP